MCSVRPTDLWSRCDIVSPQTCNILINGSTDSPVSTDGPSNTDSPTNTGDPGNTGSTSNTATDHPSTPDSNGPVGELFN